VLIPPHLVAHAGLDKEVVLAGVSDHLEIWDRTEWETQLTEMEGSAGDVAERLAAQSG
jgi:MraZ protein